LAGGPSFREVAKGWEPLLLANVVLVLASSPVQLGLVGAVGIEPTTFGLKGRCSTTELRP
jgi:hypothetical protein